MYKKYIKRLFLLISSVLILFTSSCGIATNLKDGSFIIGIMERENNKNRIKGTLYKEATLNNIDKSTMENDIFRDDNGVEYRNIGEMTANGENRYLRVKDGFPCYIPKDSDEELGMYLASEYSNMAVYDTIKENISLNVSNDASIVILNQEDQDETGVVSRVISRSEYFDDDYIRRNTDEELFYLANVEIKGGKVIKIEYIYNPFAF